MLAGALLLASCGDDQDYQAPAENPVEQLTPDSPETPALKTIVLSADIQNGGTSKAYIDGFDVKWHSDDEILVWDGEELCTFTLKSGANTTSAVFEGEAREADKYYALANYHSTGDETFDPATKTFKNVAFSDWTEQYVDCETNYSVDPSAVIMVAESDKNNNLSFKNVCSYIKVTPTVDCSAICLTALGGEYLSGYADVTIGDIPSVSFYDGYSSYDNFILFDVNYVLKANTTYYMAVPPVALQNGFDIKFYIDDNFYRSLKQSAFTFEPNKIYNGGSNKGDLFSPVRWYGWHDDNQTWRENATSIVIETGVMEDKPDDAIGVDFLGLCWAVIDNDGCCHIRTKGEKIHFGESMNNLFYEFTGVETIQGLEKIDVSGVTTFQQIFWKCESLTSLDLSSWNFDEIVNHTELMFSECQHLETLTLNSSFKGGRNKAKMFNGLGSALEPGKKCKIYGVSSDVRESLKEGTYWDDKHMEFAD